MKRKKQLFNMYKDKSTYDHKGRWLSYYYQFRTITKFDPKKILEVGIGNGTTSNYLKNVGFDVVTVDFEEALKPDIVADVVNLPFKDNAFDAVLCCEVLEHIPFVEFKSAVRELIRVGRHVYLTVPDRRRVPFMFNIKLPFLEQFNFSLRIPMYREHKFDGHHYWEIGKKDYSLKKICRTIEGSGVRILKHGSPYDAPFIHYFLLASGRKLPPTMS